MHVVPLGNQGMTVSALGLGCMGMSTTYGPSDEQENLGTLARALDLGVTLFDTAEVYGPFVNEELLGRAFSGKRDQVVISTKVGFRFTDDGQIATVDGKPLVTGNPIHVRDAVEGSLRRLRTDFIDLIYLHRIDPDTPIEASIDALSKLVRDGKVRYIGLSEASAATIRRAHAVHPLTAVQTEYSLFERGVEQSDVLNTTRELGIGFVSYSPLGRGFLSGQLKDLESLAQSDFRRLDPRFQGSNLQGNLKLLDSIVAIAQEKGVKPSQLAIAWTMSRGTVPIPGTRRIRYLEENIAAARIHLSDDELKALEAAAPMGVAFGERYAQSMMEQVGR